MNIYFSGSITGGRQDQQVYALMVNALLEGGHEVPTAILSHPRVMDYEDAVSASEVYERDVNWVRGCDALIAEVSTPSHGVGYEIALALLLGKPVLCVYLEGRRVSKMITGNDSPNLRVAAYRTPEEAVDAMGSFFEEIQPRVSPELGTE